VNRASTGSQEGRGDPEDPGDPEGGTVRRLVFAGEAIVDLVMWVPALPERGGDMIATSAGPAVGGGFNIMAAAARQGLPVLYAGGHGRGPWGDLVRSALAGEGIAVLRPPDDRADTGFDVAMVERDGERTFVTSLGAETLREPGSWDAVPAGPGDAVYVSGYGLAAAGSGAVLGEWAAALPDGVLLFVDPGPLVAEIPAGVLGPVQARCDWWSCNQREARLSTGVADPAGAAHRLLTRDDLLTRDGRPARVTANGRPAAAGAPGVIVRAGAAGCVVAHGDRLSLVPAPTVDPVDTTGAGDAHSGVFLAALADGLTPEDAAFRANVAAALSTTQMGPATAPTRAELDARLAPAR
jgi:sugar/nucleoside kinase (ribokinase family)